METDRVKINIANYLGSCVLSEEHTDYNRFYGDLKTKVEDLLLII